MRGGSESELPDGWAVVALDEIAEVRLGRQRSPDRAQGEHMRPYMRAANVTWDGISVADVKEMDFTPSEFKTYALKKGDILLSEASGSANEVGKPAIWNDEVPGACFQNTLIRVRAPSDLVPFLYWHFRHDALTGVFADASKGIGIHHLGRDKLAKWVIRLPPLAEQRRLVDRLDTVRHKVRAVRSALEGVTGPAISNIESDLDLLELSVLAKAFRGELVAQDPADEPASVLLDRIRGRRTAAPKLTLNPGRVARYVLLLLRAWNGKAGREMVERGLMLMVHDDLRDRLLGGRRSGKKSPAEPPPGASWLDRLFGQMRDAGQIRVEQRGRKRVFVSLLPPADLDDTREDDLKRLRDALTLVGQIDEKQLAAEIAEATHGQEVEFEVAVP